MKPWKLLLFLLACLSSFLILGIAFPEGWQIGSLNIRFYRIQDLLQEKAEAVPEKKIDKSALLKLQEKAQVLVEQKLMKMG